MGLLDRVERRGPPEKAPNQGIADKEAIRRHIGRRIRTQEHADVHEPTVHYHAGKVHVRRPQGTLSQLQQQAAASSGRIDAAKLKEAVKAKLVPGAPVPASAMGRVTTGIPGLDEVMSGGFRRKNANLVAGGSGSGKSIFAMQFLVTGIEQFNEPGVYVSFEESEEDILSDMESFGWDLREKIRQKRLVVISYTPEQVENVLKTGGGTIRDTVESIGATRIVFDSLTAFTLLHETAFAQRRASLALFDALKKWGCTSLLVAEQELNPEEHISSVEEFEVDGVILLYNIRRGNIRERALEVFKMRATKHSAKIFPMTISNEGIRIYPDEDVY